MTYPYQVGVIKNAGIKVIDEQEFSVSGTWTKPENFERCEVICFQAGTNGAQWSTQGGRGGAIRRAFFYDSDLAGTVNVTVGAASGGQSYFGSYLRSGSSAGSLKQSVIHEGVIFDTTDHTQGLGGATSLGGLWGIPYFVAGGGAESTYSSSSYVGSGNPSPMYIGSRDTINSGSGSGYGAGINSVGDPSRGIGGSGGTAYNHGKYPGGGAGHSYGSGTPTMGGGGCVFIRSWGG